MKWLWKLLAAIFFLAVVIVAVWLGVQKWTVGLDQTPQRFFVTYWPWELGMIGLLVALAVCWTLAAD